MVDITHEQVMDLRGQDRRAFAELTIAIDEYVLVRIDPVVDIARAYHQFALMLAAIEVYEEAIIAVTRAEDKWQAQYDAQMQRDVTPS